MSFYKTASQFIKKYYEEGEIGNTLFIYRFLASLANEAGLIAESLGLQGMDYEDAIVATWFRYAGASDVDTGQTDDMKAILIGFFDESGYPEEHRVLVANAIQSVVNNRYAENQLEQVVSDALNSQLADPNFPQNVLLLKEVLNRLNTLDHTESYYLKYFLSLFVKMRFYTSYANERYYLNLQKNFEFAGKRLKKIEEEISKSDKSKFKSGKSPLLSDKETEDLFKIAFRNYNHLISVADSKASLLINVNSIIISVMIAFVLGKIEKSFFILWPTIILLSVCMTTILLAILASRPQNSSFLENKKSHSYQKFFFGSFDMVDPSFRSALWDEYFDQLMELFSKPKESVYLEVYKESFNVRKVLSKKFNYLSLAYWVFLFGLMISIISFVVAICNRG